MEVLVNAWDWLNHILGYPLIALIASLILGSPFFFAIVRKTTARCFTASWDWLMERSQGLFNRAPAARTLQRLGVKIGLDKEIEYYLGKIDPNRVGPDNIDHLIQGPFCAKCSYLLTEWSGREAYVCDRCPQCPYKLARPASGMELNEFKEFVYKALDAEKRQTGRLKDSDGR